MCKVQILLRMSACVSFRQTGPADNSLLAYADRPDKWGSITVDSKALLDGGSLWSVTFTEHSLAARAGGAPLLAVSRNATTLGAVSIDLVAVAASPAVHRVLVGGFSTLEPTGMFELSLEGVATRAISVDASADDVQNVSFGLDIFHLDGLWFNYPSSTQPT